ncbi:acyltransferase [Riemerella anatipestifer]|uniref:acyltransferase n=1 Tax=Riemerella anatipestifer TaxID=34085 RepID=UPI003BFA6AFF
MNNLVSVVMITYGHENYISKAIEGRIYDHNYQYTKGKVEHHIFTKAPIKIGKNCWLGSNVVVLKGVTVGDNVIIGAGCTIYKDIPANSIVVNKQELMVKSL